MITKKFPLFLAIFCSFVFGGEISYPNEVKQLYLNKGDKNAIGRLLPTAKIEILKNDGDFAQIKISGFIQNNKKQILYFNPDNRILNAAFKANSDIKYETINKQTNEVSTILWTQNTNFEKNYDELMKKANKLYADNCAMCHALHNINEFSANQWPAMLKAMIDRTTIEKEDRFLVEQFLQKNNNKTMIRSKR